MRKTKKCFQFKIMKENERSKQTHRCGPDRRSLTSPPIPVILQETKKTSTRVCIYTNLSDLTGETVFTFPLPQIFLSLFKQTGQVNHHSIACLQTRRRNYLIHLIACKINTHCIYETAKKATTC